MPPTDFECLLQIIGGEISREHEIQTISSPINQTGCHSTPSCQRGFFYKSDVHGQDFQAVVTPSKFGLRSVEILAQLLNSNGAFHSQ